MDYNLILHLDSDDEAIFRMVARNAFHYLNGLADEQFELDVVVNAAGVRLFTEGHDELRHLAEPLMERGVKFKLCANALRDNNIEPARLWQGCEVVPAGLVEIVRLQRAGFAYIKP